MVESIFNESQLSALSLALEKGDCPVKFTYITNKGAEAWNEIEIERARSGGNYAEYELLRDNIGVYLQDIGNPQEIALFDFGCGTGKTVKGMLEQLCEMGLKVHYHAFDISEKITALAKETIGDLGPNYSFDYTILDFETYNLTNVLFDTRKRYCDIPVIGMLLGSTIGNFDSMERIISNIIEAFRIQDRLIIGVEKFDVSNEKRMAEMINGYKQDLPFNLTFSTLETFGITKDSGVYNVIFNNKTNSIEGYFEFSRDVQFEILSRKICFDTGDKVRLFKSTKMNETQLSKLVLDLDLRIASMRTNLKNTFIEILMGAKRY